MYLCPLKSVMNCMGHTLYECGILMWYLSENDLTISCPYFTQHNNLVLSTQVMSKLHTNLILSIYMTLYFKTVVWSKTWRTFKILNFTPLTITQNKLSVPLSATYIFGNFWPQQNKIHNPKFTLCVCFSQLRNTCGVPYRPTISQGLFYMIV